jgi:hypothetical protein
MIELVGETSVRVNWDTPTFTDNSGLPQLVESNIRHGSTLSVGEHIVHYKATDQSGNTNYSCQFKIHIKGASILSKMFKTFKIVYLESLLFSHVRIIDVNNAFFFSQDLSSD